MENRNIWKKPAIRIAAIYFVISFLWILLSDMFVENISSTTALSRFWQTIKGWLFISISTLIIYYLIHKAFLKEKRINQQLKLKEQSLNESRLRYKSIFDLSNVGIAYVSESGIVLEANNTFWDVINDDATDYDQKHNPFFDLVNKQTTQQAINKDGQIDNQEHQFVSKKGNEKWIGISLKKIELKRLSQYLVVIDDITDQVKHKEDIAHYQQQLKNTINEIFATEEREKRRLAVDLHDNFSQLLAIAKLKMAEYLRKQPDDERIAPLVDSKNFIEEALHKTRALTYELSPPILYELGLIQAMEWHLNNIKENYLFDLRFFKKTSQIGFSIEIQIIIYRVFSEMMNNVIKHANAQQVLVYIEQMYDVFYLRVIDNGIGFDTNINEPMKNSFGLFSVKERIENLEGSFQIISAPKKGTIVDIAIPTK